jgi:uncharacterized protein
MTSDPVESPTEIYWRTLGEGRFQFQRCASCGHAWLPPREDCPCCWSREWQWQDASGLGTVVSWVVFHTAFHEAFEKRLPYNVAVVELAEGPRLITNIVGLQNSSCDNLVDRPVSLVIERDHERALPRFRLT